MLLASAEHNRDLDLVALAKEPHDVTLLGLIVVSVDLGAKLHFFDDGVGLVATGFTGLLGVLVFELPVVHELADRGSTHRSDLDKVEVGFDGPSATTLTKALHFQDTWHGALGAQYRLSDTWTLTGGVAYDSSAVDDANRTLSLPMGESYRFGLGARWQVSQKLNFGAAYEFMWAGTMPVVQDSVYRGRVAGAFEDAYFCFASVDLCWKF